MSVIHQVAIIAIFAYAGWQTPSFWPGSASEPQEQVLIDDEIEYSLFFVQQKPFVAPPMK
jgi:hypothetical protein